MIKKYVSELAKMARENGLLYFILFISALVFIIKPVHEKVSHLIIVLFYISFLIQCILLLKKSYVFYILRVMIIVGMCFEIVFGKINDSKVQKRWEDGHYFLADTLLGSKFSPCCFREKSISFYGNDTVYSVFYSADKFGRRISDDMPERISDTNSTGKKHAIFLGCSFTFGEGLPNSSTFPFLFGQLHPDFKSYNMGFRGYGPHQSCLFFDEGINTINNYSIPEDSGICVYTFIPDHLNRVWGGGAYLSYGSATPDVYIVDNKLMHKKRSPVQLELADYTNASSTLKYFNLNFTYPKTEKLYKRFADILNYTAYKYWQLKPKGIFYVSIYPAQTPDLSWAKFLDKRIKFLVVDQPADYEKDKYRIKNDGHPKKNLNIYYLNEISKHIIKDN